MNIEELIKVFQNFVIDHGKNKARKMFFNLGYNINLTYAIVECVNEDGTLIKLTSTPRDEIDT